MPTTDSRQDIKHSILKAVQMIDDNYEGLILAALYISFNESRNMIRIYRIDQETDEEIPILTHDISPWQDAAELDRHTIYARLEDIVSELDNEKAFYPIRRYTPFYIYYADKESATSERLITISGEDTTGAKYSVVDDILDIFDGLF